MGKSTEPPTCRFCGKQHRGTCMDHEAKGAISSQIGYPSTPGLKAAAARVIKGIESSGGSSAVERMPSKQTVGGSTPPPRSRKIGEDKAKRSAGRGPKLERQLAPVTSAGLTDPPKGRGRPKVHPDRKAYLAEKARERRARRKSTNP